MLASIMVCSSILSAQKVYPKFTTATNGANLGSGIGSSYNLRDDSTKRIQIIYLPGDFPNAPTGTMTAVYFKITYARQDVVPTVLYDFRLRMGASPKASALTG